MSDGPLIRNGLSMLGEVAWLMAHSSLHSGWPMDSLLQWVAPALALRQCRLYHRGQRPLAYVSWARMSKEAEEAYVLNPRSLQTQDWQSGERLWLIDLVAPFGDGKAVARDLREIVFPDGVARALRVKPGSDEMRIVYLHGIHATAKSRDATLNPAVDLQGAVQRRATASEQIFCGQAGSS